MEGQSTELMTTNSLLRLYLHTNASCLLFHAFFVAEHFFWFAVCFATLTACACACDHVKSVLVKLWGSYKVGDFLRRDEVIRSAGVCSHGLQDKFLSEDCEQRAGL